MPDSSPPSSPSPARSPARQIRAYWVDAFNPGIKSPAEIDRLLADVRASGANAVVVQMRRRGDAYFGRRVEPRTEDPAIAPDFDALEYLIEKARAGDQPIQVHAWVAALPIWRAGAWSAPRDPAHVFNQHGPSATGRDNWLAWAVNDKQFDGENYAIDPGHPDAADYTVRVVTDLVRAYDVDGIHLDYIRYADRDWGYNPTSVARFNARHGRQGQPDPKDPRWSDWRREQVTNLVRRIYLDATSVRPSVQVSAALIAWGAGPADDDAWLESAPYARTYQDWRAWLAEGILDVGYLMAYFKEGAPKYPRAFDEWTAYALRNQGRRAIVVGPGLFLNNQSDSRRQVERALAAGAPGVALYSYHSFVRDKAAARAGFRDALLGTPERPGPFAEPAVPSPLAWKTASPEAHLAGRLLDSSGKPVDGAEISVTGPVTRTVRTDGSGAFGALALPPGDYRLEARADTAQTRATVILAPGRIATVDFRLGR